MAEKWINAHGRHGLWTTLIDGQHLTIYWVAGVKGNKLHYRRTTQYNTEMFNHQFYETLAEAKKDSVRMLKKHMAEYRARQSRGRKT